MRLSQRSAFGLIFGGSLAIASGLTGAACSGNNFDGCDASRTCGSGAAGSAGSSSLLTAGHGGGNAGGKAGQGGASGFVGKGSGGQGAKLGAGGRGDAGSPDDDAGEGNTHATSGSGGTGGTHNDTTSAGGSGGKPTKPAGDAGSDAEGGMGGERGRDHDTKAPSIVTVTPPYGAQGVTSDTEIVIDFDEPMDNATTEAAYQSPDLPPDAVKLFWRNDSKELVIQPLMPLQYVSVSAVSKPDAKHYEFTIAGTAKDTSGNALAQDQHYYFTTLRDVSQVIPLPKDGGRLLREFQGGSYKRYVECSAGTDTLHVGDDSDDSSYAALLTFDLGNLPAGIVEWKRASLAIDVEPGSARNAFDTSTPRLGALEYYGLSVDPDSVAWDSPATQIGTLSTYLSDTDPTGDVLKNVENDYAAAASQSNRSEYLLRFDKATDDDGMASYIDVLCGSAALRVQFLAP